MAKLLAFDFGKKRTGIAETDDLQIIASGLTTIQTSELKEFLMDYLIENEVELFVVGLPKQLDNTASESKEIIDQQKQILSSNYPEIPIVEVDERFTSKMAFQTMIDSGINKKKRRDKKLVDQISATIILQSFLYSR